MAVFNGIWVGWSGDFTGIDADTYLIRMTARPDTVLDMSRVTPVALPSANAVMLNVGGMWSGGEQNNWAPFFETYSSGNALQGVLGDAYCGIVLDLETADGEEPSIDFAQLQAFIAHAKSQGYLCFVACFASVVEMDRANLAESEVDALVPLLYNGTWTEAFQTGWEDAYSGSGAPLAAGIAVKDQQHYGFLNQSPPQAGAFVWGIGNGGGDATGAECQALLDTYAPAK
ncbi:hypothetical protein AIOL_001569 [Candidatus Rhodobacter oscarellae]|uniref:Uncharacterized protein n=1 Tax=Candidatus Rhodobacter oscarellae TaxID=1675527 RepID=A0A0J9E1M9_9RHOB|nr:hypothetical protein [Candidatus Rhodobacter lobularis]KMW56615.1 hypothetical protein AIOL_001569 [Candidatus Rhodobacter lobularis]